MEMVQFITLIGNYLKHKTDTISIYATQKRLDILNAHHENLNIELGISIPLT